MTPSRRISRAVVAATAVAAPVAIMAPAPSAQAAPATPQLPRAPHGMAPLPQAPAPVLPAVETTVTRWVGSTVGANVRSGPSTSYAIVGGKAYGTKVTGTMTSSGWLKIADGQYISGATLVTSDPTGGSIAPDEPSTSTVTRYVSVSVGANVRSGPSTSYAIVGGKAYGTKLTGTLTSNGWLKIAAGQYVSPGTLSTTNPTGGSTAPDEPTLTTTTRYVASSVANVRSGPSTGYSVIGTKTAGTKVTGTISNGWMKLSGESGYMSETTLTSTVPAAAPTPAPAPGTTDLRASILATAAQYVGYPYVLYGTPPAAFDCSSYVAWVYAQNGITIPRTVWQQKEFVTPVTTPQPGDLVFFGDWYHVAIYAGDGMWYEAMNPDVDVVYHKAWTSNVWYGRVPGV